MATVFIECGWNWDRDTADPVMIPVPETAAVAELARRSDTAGGARIAAIVGHADLRHGAAAGRALDALAAAGDGRFVGIRHATAWDADPSIPNHRTDPVAGLMDDATWRAGFAELARRGLTYDAWLYHPQIPELVRLARDFPDVQMICDHLGGPLGVRSYAGRRDEVWAATRASLQELASCPNVALKLGGIGMPIMGDRWHRGERPPSSVELAATWGDSRPLVRRDVRRRPLHVRVELPGRPRVVLVRRAVERVQADGERRQRRREGGPVRRDGQAGVPHLLSVRISCVFASASGSRLEPRPAVGRPPGRMPR